MTAIIDRPASGARTSGLVSRAVRPAALLRLEGGALGVAAIGLYAAGEMSWVLFGALILAPDVGLLGYLVGPRFGAHAYNMTHNIVLPVIVASVGWATATPTALAIALIWVAHIGLDRALGYGLKYPDDFRRTHLQRLPG